MSRSLPESYRLATWRNTLPVDADGACLGVGFDVGSEVLRLRLPVESARALAETILEYLGDA